MLRSWSQSYIKCLLPKTSAYMELCFWKDELAHFTWKLNIRSFITKKYATSDALSQMLDLVKLILLLRFWFEIHLNSILQRLVSMLQQLFYLQNFMWWPSTWYLLTRPSDYGVSSLHLLILLFQSSVGWSTMVNPFNFSRNPSSTAVNDGFFQSWFYRSKSEKLRYKTSGRILSNHTEIFQCIPKKKSDSCWFFHQI